MVRIQYMRERFSVTPCILSWESDGGPEKGTITRSRKNTWCNHKPLSQGYYCWRICVCVCVSNTVEPRYKEIRYNKPSYDKVILLVQTLYISLGFIFTLGWYSENPDMKVIIMVPRTSLQRGSAVHVCIRNRWKYWTFSYFLQGLRLWRRSKSYRHSLGQST